MDNLIEKVVNGNGDSDKHLLTLFSFALSLNAKNILELGVRHGDSTLPLLMATQYTEGHVTSVDIDETSFIPPPNFKNNWTFVKENALDFLHNSDKTRPFDLIYVDDWHSYEHVKKEMEYIDALVSLKV